MGRFEAALTAGPGEAGRRGAGARRSGLLSTPFDHPGLQWCRRGDRGIEASIEWHRCDNLIYKPRGTRREAPAYGQKGEEMVLKASLGSYPHTAALLEGMVEPKGFEVEYLDVGGVVGGFRRMMRGNDLDFCEMGLTTYLSGWDYRNELTAIPAHVACGFPFASIMINAASGVDEPKDLEGKRVACRTYTVTSVVWARGAIQDLFGVDLDSITWVVSGEEHAAEFVWPKNVEYQKDADLSGMVASGEVAAGFAVFRGQAENVRPLFPDVESIEKEWFAHSRVFPINHSVALPRTLAESDPDLPGHLYRYFVEGKQVFLDRLAEGAELSEADQALARRRALLGPDPLPYGVEATRPTLEALLRYCYEQHITREHLGVDEIFAPGSAQG